MDRRTFLSWVGVGFVASSLPIAIAACSAQAPEDDTASTGDSTSPPESGGGQGGFIAVGSTQVLESDGVLKSNALPSGPILVIKDAQNPGSLIALSSTCTHAGCTVAWTKGESAFICPCHNSKFNPDGSVANGPAKSALKTFDVKVEADQVLVKAV